eukprot:CAMPEP_0178387830 /NCGR_PEP_ID=MMETSP0689_2-20121128/9277_1 /TAXON_ID=160604 /ORGANISM="Amphidinium massartii, Strain CS-259" /LENGTH=150 /DNA_ID=CAMNT_0020008209 /DNA_START=455 /DNA_END=904 /DNA_ORIENTATION=+
MASWAHELLLAACLHVCAGGDHGSIAHAGTWTADLNDIFLRLLQMPRHSQVSTDLHVHVEGICISPVVNCFVNTATPHCWVLMVCCSHGGQSVHQSRATSDAQLVLDNRQPWLEPSAAQARAPRTVNTLQPAVAGGEVPFPSLILSAMVR